MVVGGSDADADAESARDSAADVDSARDIDTDSDRDSDGVDDVPAYGVCIGLSSRPEQDL